MLIGPNIEWEMLAPGSHFAMVSRIQTMTPATSENLDRFLNEYHRAGNYYLVPGHIDRVKHYRVLPQIWQFSIRTSTCDQRGRFRKTTPM